MTTGTKLLHGCMGFGGALLLALMAAGCTKGYASIGNANGIGGDLPKVTVEAVGPTPQALSKDFDVTVERADAGYAVTVYAGDGLKDDLDQVFLEARFDGEELVPSNITSLIGDPMDSTVSMGGEAGEANGGDGTPVSLSGGTAGAHSAGGEGDSSAPVSLAGQVNAGAVQFGVVALEDHDTVQSASQAVNSVVAPGQALFSFTLAEPGPGRVVSSAPGEAPESRAKNLDLRQNSDGNWVLSWDYTNPGDTNQDGVVSVMDLSPIGLHFMEHVGAGISDPLRHVDGDGNGLINVQDVTPIGMNFSSQLFAYQIEMREPGSSDWVTVGQLLLGDQQQTPGETVRFSYTFSSQYVNEAYYRVKPLNKDLQFGPPSECLSESARELDEVPASTDQTMTVTVKALDLANPIQQLSSVRIVFPASFDYVPKSFNVGSLGGAKDESDGLWASFAQGFLLAPDAFFQPQTLPDGRRFIEFNVTVLQHDLEVAPVSYGDLFNFQLKSNGSEPLALSFQLADNEGRRSTYYFGGNGEALGDQVFGNRLGVEVR